MSKNLGHGLGHTSDTRVRSSLAVQTINERKNNLGNVELKLNFGRETVDSGSCGAILNGQNWIIGGRKEKRQVSY